MKKYLLWDCKNRCEATNYDGSDPIVESSGVVRIKTLTCDCDPGNPCGGCRDVWEEHSIGGEYFFKAVEEYSNSAPLADPERISCSLIANNLEKMCVSLNKVAKGLPCGEHNKQSFQSLCVDNNITCSYNSGYDSTKCNCVDDCEWKK